MQLVIGGIFCLLWSTAVPVAHGKCYCWCHCWRDRCNVLPLCLSPHTKWNLTLCQHLTVCVLCIKMGKMVQRFVWNRPQCILWLVMACLLNISTWTLNSVNATSNVKTNWSTNISRSRTYHKALSSVTNEGNTCKYRPIIKTHSLNLWVSYLNPRDSHHQSRETLSAITYGDKLLQVEQQLWSFPWAGVRN